MPRCPVCESLYIRVTYGGDVCNGACSECKATWLQNPEGTDHWSIHPGNVALDESPPKD